MDAGIGVPELAAKRKEQKRRQDRENGEFARMWAKLTYAKSLGWGKVNLGKVQREYKSQVWFIKVRLSYITNKYT